MIIVTTNDLPGFRILAVHGEVMGLTVRSRDAATSWVAGWRAIGGGEIPEFTQMLIESRMQVMGRMVEEAQRRGANAIVAMRFDANEIAQAWTEICAYGTAVTVEPIADGPGATAQSRQLASQPVPTLQPQAPAQGYAPPQMVPPMRGEVPWPPPPGPGGPPQR
ncbi:hypothetical protein GCM10009846_07640 [Agrococcus versicolor]|uniref:UPF0145 protein GCM10009846_07640 n=1 Tax=Agrococcus versicolor TaxID=501482 RepID=A0ABN3ALJ3_9MICO